VQEARQQ